MSGVTSRPCSVVVLVHLALECFWHLQSGLFRTLGPARGAHPLEAHLNPLAAHQRAPEVVPIIPDPNLSPDLDLGQDLNPGKSGFWFKVHNKIIVWDFGFLTCDFFFFFLSAGLDPIEVHADTTPVPALVPAGAAPGADLVALSTAGAGATAAPPCRIDADTLATGYGATLLTCTQGVYGDASHQFLD